MVGGNSTGPHGLLSFTKLAKQANALQWLSHEVLALIEKVIVEPKPGLRNDCPELQCVVSAK